MRLSKRMPYTVIGLLVVVLLTSLFVVPRIAPSMSPVQDANASVLSPKKCFTPKPAMFPNRNLRPLTAPKMSPTRCKPASQRVNKAQDQFRIGPITPVITPTILVPMLYTSPVALTSNNSLTLTRFGKLVNFFSRNKTPTPDKCTDCFGTGTLPRYAVEQLGRSDGISRFNWGREGVVRLPDTLCRFCGGSGVKKTANWSVTVAGVQRNKPRNVVRYNCTISRGILGPNRTVPFGQDTCTYVSGNIPNIKVPHDPTLA